MKDQLEQVRLFMKAVKQETPAGVKIPSEEVLALRMRLTFEETKEFRNACRAGDIVEMVDGLADRMYVLLGDFAACGVSGELAVKLFNEVQRSNMTKLDENGIAIMDEMGKVLKPAHFSRPELKKVLIDYINGTAEDYILEEGVKDDVQ